MFITGLAWGIAILRPGHGPTAQQRHAAQLAEAASGGHAVRTACTFDQCGVVIRPTHGACRGWVVPIGADGSLGTPRRGAYAHC